MPAATETLPSVPMVMGATLPGVTVTWVMVTGAPLSVSLSSTLPLAPPPVPPFTGPSASSTAIRVPAATVTVIVTLSQMVGCATWQIS